MISGSIGKEKGTVDEIKPIRELAWRMRKDILDMTFRAGVEGGHIGGAFSSAEILATLYGSEMRIDPSDPTDPARDRFILSKGHISLAHYAVLKERGFLSQEDLEAFERNGSLFSTHEMADPEHGIEFISGSLGYGLSVGVGMAIAAKRRGMDHRIFVLLGDGECNEGCIWEGAMAAAKYKLDDLIVFVDKNGQQLDGYTNDVMPIDNIGQVFRGFGWNTHEIDGHDIAQIQGAVRAEAKGKPKAIIAHTVKGKGIPSIEGKLGWHHASITEEQYTEYKLALESAG